LRPSLQVFIKKPWPGDEEPGQGSPDGFLSGV